MSMSPKHMAANVERFSGYADTYDAYRPQPPAALPSILTQLAQIRRPRLVVDLGSGTGLSTFVWADIADEVIGIEPNADMRAKAARRVSTLPATANVHFENTVSSETRLPDECADIVTCSQSLHWMEPEPTFAEAARILRPGGIFAAYDCDWPPTMHWEAEVAFQDFCSRAEAIGEERGFFQGFKKWNKEQHLARIKASGHFRFVKEILVHHIENGNADRLVGIALSQGSIATLLKRGLTLEEIGIDKLRGIAERTLGRSPIPWYFCYRVRIGVK
jgi:SAM-dependent methyltransferase